MKHNEYIVPIGEKAKDYDEMFIGVIRRQPELIRCKDCKYYTGYECQRSKVSNIRVITNEDDYCSRAERKEE